MALLIISILTSLLEEGPSILAKAELLEQSEQVAEPLEDTVSFKNATIEDEFSLTDDLNESEITGTNSDALDITENVLSSNDSKNGTATLDGDLEEIILLPKKEEIDASLDLDEDDSAYAEDQVGTEDEDEDDL